MIKNLPVTKNKKITHLNIRIDETTQKILNKITNEYKMTHSEYARWCIQSSIYLMNTKKPSFKKWLDIQKKNIECEKARDEMRIKNHARYIIANTIRTCIQFAKTSLFLTGGSVNMKVIIGSINDAEKVYKTFSPELQKELSEDWILIQKFKQEDHIIKFVNNLYKRKEMIK